MSGLVVAYKIFLLAHPNWLGLGLGLDNLLFGFYLIFFQLTVTEVQLKAAEEERDTLKEDVANTEAGKDVLIKKAWETRDAAVKRKNNTEIELAKTRIDVMQINSQLMEAIQQKVELSQQLDQVQKCKFSQHEHTVLLSFQCSGSRTWRSCWRIR